MRGKRCQVCDGPIANGRCRYCGMPYRNDEVLYHLNESRSDHYRHATEKARATMRQQQIPLGDRKREQDRSSAKAEIRVRQEQERQAAMQRMTNTRVPVSNKTAAPKADIRGQRKTYSSPPVNSGKTRKKGKLGKIIALIIILWSVLPGVAGVIVETVQDKVISSYSYRDYEEIGDHRLAAFLNIDEMVIAGESNNFPAGEYIIYIEDGYADVLVGNAENAETYRLEAGMNMISVTVEDGDAIAVHDTDTESRYVDIYEAD